MTVSQLQQMLNQIAWYDPDFCVSTKNWRLYVLSKDAGDVVWNEDHEFDLHFDASENAWYIDLEEST